MEKKRRFGKPIMIGAGLVIVLFLFACLFACLVFNDPNGRAVQADAQTDTIAAKLTQAALTGEPAQLTSEEISTLLTGSAGSVFHSTKLSVSAVQCEAQKDGSVLIYMPVTVRGTKLGVTARAQVGCENEKLFAKFTSVWMGRLPIKPEWAVAWVKDVLPSEAYAQGNTIRVNSSAMSTRVLNGTVSLHVNSLQVTESGFFLGVKADTKMLKEQLQKGLGGLAGVFG